jgi:DNA-binding response OmpR family regulator
MKVLLVDDDRMWIALLEASFRERGFDVLTAFDGVQATMQAFQGGPDLIVLDVQMPGGTGFEALKRLKMSSKTVRIPVLVVSGVEDPSLVRKLAGLGAAEHVAKPTTTDRVCAAASALLGAST